MLDPKGTKEINQMIKMLKEAVATLYPAGATGTVTWAVTTGDTYASVDEDGKVTALAEGSATVTATCNGKTDTCTVTVTAATD